MKKRASQNSSKKPKMLLGKKTSPRKHRKAKPRAQQSILSRKLAAIMFTDMVGYTAMAQQDEARAVELLEEHRRLLRPIFHRHVGREIDTIGDAFLVEFASALDAVKCALEIQSFLKALNKVRTDERKILLRVGIHLGDLIHKGKSVSGDAVNVASRIEPLAEPGGVCLTAQVYYSVFNKVECKFESMGNPRLKNVTMPLEVFRISGFGDALIIQPQQAVTLQKNRIAVLPFSSLSPDPNDEYFADGITEELISTISKISALQVIARTSVIRYKKTTKSVDEIGKELKVGTVLEGSVRKSENKLRITAQLINSDDNRHLWSETYDREFKDVFAIQSDISTMVAQELKVRLLPQEDERIRKEPTKNPEAHVLYLQALQYFQNRKVSQIQKAIQCLEKAIQLDPNFALAYAALANCYNQVHLAEAIGASYIDLIKKASVLSRKALELDETLAEAHSALANVVWQTQGLTRQGWLEEEREFRRAIELNPNYSGAHEELGIHLLQDAKLDDAISEFKKALELDPLSYRSSDGIGYITVLKHEYEKAVEYYRKFQETYPEQVDLAHLLLARAYRESSRFEEAKSELDLVILNTDQQKDLELWFAAKISLGILYAKQGMEEETLRILDELKVSSAAFSDYASISEIYCALGDKEKAMLLLEECYEQRQPFPLALIKAETGFDLLRSDPRFIALLQKIGLMSPEEVLEAEQAIQKLQREEMKFDKKRIAILPFANLSPDPNDEYFADGMTEELISTVSKKSGLKVIARTSVMVFKGEKKKISDVARELNVGTVLEGSVRKSGDKLRITAQLIDSQTSEHIWSESYDRHLVDVFAIQSEISESVAESLKVQFLPFERNRISKKPTENTEAYLMYLKGVHNRSSDFTESGQKRAIEYFEKTIEIDPNFAAAYAVMSDCYDTLGGMETSSLILKRNYFSKAEDLAQEAIKIDPGIAEVHFALCNVKIQKGELNPAEVEIRKALELNPNFAGAHYSYGWILLARRRVDEGLVELGKALELDPLSANTNHLYLGALYYARKYELSESYARKMLNVDLGIDKTFIRSRLGLVYFASSRYEESLAEFVLCLDASKAESQPAGSGVGLLAVVYAKLGRRDIALRILDKLIKKDSEDSNKLPIFFVCISVGEIDKALEYLRRAKVEELAGSLATLANDPFLDRIRGDPRFIEVMKKAGL